MEKAKILIVEDEAIIAMEIENQLQSLGYEVTSIVDTGEKAIEKAEADKPDLILMDIRIKGEMDGIEAAEEVRNKYGIPVIFSTAYLDEERIERAKITMPFGYVLKPIQERDLKVTIEMALYVTKVESERKKAEETYRSIFMNSQVGLFRTDLETGFLIDANDSLAHFAGYKNRKEFLAQPYSMAERYVDAGTREKIVSQLKEKGEVKNFETRFRRDDDSIIWLKFSAKIIPDKGWMEGVSEDITTEKEIEKALRESEEKYCTLFETGSDALFVIDTDSGSIQEVNQAAIELTGYSSDELHGLSIKDLSAEPEIIEEAVNSAQKQFVPLRYAKKKDGTLIPVEISANIFSLKGKKINISAVRDITERMQAEEQIAKSQLLLEASIENSKMPILSIDKQYRYLYFNSTHKDAMVSAYKKNIEIGMNLLDCISNEEDRKKSKISFDHALEGKNHVTVEEYGDFERLYYETRYIPILDNDSEIIGATAFIEDITSRKQAEEQAQASLKEKETLLQEIDQSKKRFEDIVELLPGAIVEMDTNLMVTYVNQAGLDLFGYTDQDIKKGMMGVDLLHPDDREKAVQHMADYYDEKRLPPTEYRVLRNNGKAIPILFNAVPILQVGEITGFRAVMTDIRRLKRVEKVIKASLNEKETLLHEVHHRVKNNMQIISSLLKLQSNNIKDNQIKDVLKESQSRIYAMSAVHETLHGSEDLSEINLRTYLSKITSSIFQTYSTNHDRVTMNTDIEKIPIGINQASPLGLVINELISNSLKYAFPNEREGEISVSLKKQGRELELTVKDNGVGMPNKMDWRNSSTLGLKLVRTLVENQLDGSIEMESNNGSKFTIKFNIET